MRAHYLQHVAFEGLGSIDAWLRSAGFKITATKFYEPAVLPAFEAFDFLIIMGGPMSVNDDKRHPWLKNEKQFIRQAIQSAKPVLGICLGAQLIAASLGASVSPNRHKEIGWFPLQGIAHENKDIFSFANELTVFHWHGDTFDLPAGAALLASSEGCTNQAFQIGSSVIGLQFHLEVTPDSIAAIINHCRDEIVPSRFVQTPARMLEGSPHACREVNGLMGDILSFLTGKVSGDGQ